MAKRKRLTPANPDYLADSASGDPAAASAAASASSAAAANGPAAVRGPALAADPAAAAGPGGRGAAGARPGLAPIAQVAGESSSAAALGELSRAMEEARAQGRMIIALKLDEVAAGHLVRDRLGADEEELSVLMESLAARGQQTPVEVVDRGVATAPRYGLISGWRRLSALRRLEAEGRGPGEVLAVIRSPRSAPEAYLAMVEENEIRVGLSYYERARIVVQAVEQGVFDDRESALRGLFGAVSRAKRSKIGSFATIVAALDGALTFPTALAERAGLDLARRLAADPDLGPRLRAELAATPPADAAEELARLCDGNATGSASGASGTGSKTRARGRAEESSEGSACAPGTGDGSAGDAATPGTRPKVDYDADAGRIVLSGPGVNASLAAAIRQLVNESAG